MNLNQFLYLLGQNYTANQDYFCFRAIAVDAQGSLLDLQSGVLPSGAQGPIGVLSIEP